MFQEERRWHEDEGGEWGGEEAGGSGGSLLGQQGAFQPEGPAKSLTCPCDGRRSAVGEIWFVSEGPHTARTAPHSYESAAAEAVLILGEALSSVWFRWPPQTPRHAHHRKPKPRTEQQIRINDGRKTP